MNQAFDPALYDPMPAGICRRGSAQPDGGPQGRHRTARRTAWDWPCHLAPNPCRAPAGPIP